MTTLYLPNIANRNMSLNVLFIQSAADFYLKHSCERLQVKSNILSFVQSSNNVSKHGSEGRIVGAEEMTKDVS